MDHVRHYKGIAALCVVIALAVGVTAVFGVFGRGDGATATGVSIRGEEFEYATTGVYAYNAERVVAEGVGWDMLTLFVVVPALLASAVFVARGSLKGRLVAAGLLGYVAYQYLMYAVFWALGPLLPAFVVLYPLALAGIVWIVSTIDVPALPSRFSARFPRKTMAVFSALMALQLIVMWSQRIAIGLSGDLAGASLLGTTTLAVQALDLGIIVPLALATAYFAWRRRPIGYLLTAVFAVKGVTMSGAICAMLISAWMVEGALDVGPFALFATATAAAGLIAYRVFASVLPCSGVPSAAAQTS